MMFGKTFRYAVLLGLTHFLVKNCKILKIGPGLVFPQLPYLVGLFVYSRGGGVWGGGGVGKVLISDKNLLFINVCVSIRRLSLKMIYNNMKPKTSLQSVLHSKTALKLIQSWPFQSSFAWFW